MKVTKEQFEQHIDGKDYTVAYERGIEYSYDNYVLNDPGGSPLQEYNDDGSPNGLIGFICYHGYRETEYHAT